NRYSCNSCGENPSEFKITIGSANENGKFHGICTSINLCGECAGGLADVITFYLLNPIVKTRLEISGVNDIDNNEKSVCGERGVDHELA
ncbi:MAG: hypothetical protein FWD71_23415, partial [Oscillospiraceae bacterium]|nr:hypothetical protein [Oscillospiraceae bacterium]